MAREPGLELSCLMEAKHDPNHSPIFLLVMAAALKQPPRLVGLFPRLALV